MYQTNESLHVLVDVFGAILGVLSLMLGIACFIQYGLCYSGVILIIIGIVLLMVVVTNNYNHAKDNDPESKTEFIGKQSLSNTYN